MNLEFFMGIAAGMACCGFWMFIFREKKQPRDERGRFAIVDKHLLVHNDDSARMSEAIDHIHNRFTPKEERADYMELCRKLDGYELNQKSSDIAVVRAMLQSNAAAYSRGLLSKAEFGECEQMLTVALNRLERTR